MKTTAIDQTWTETTFRRIMMGFTLPDPKAFDILRRRCAARGAMGISQAHYNQLCAGRGASAREMSRWLDPELYVRTLKRLGIQVLYYHAKNHTGVACYATRLGHRYSLMGNRDFFGELVRACRANGIVPGAMFQVGMDELAAAQHPDWLQRDATGKTTRFRLCHNHPEWRARVLGQTKEIVGYDIGAFMYDELSFGWGNIGTACYCPHCQAAFRAAVGEEMPTKENWSDPLWRRFVRWRYENIASLLQEAGDLIRKANPTVAFTEVYYAGVLQSWRDGWSSEKTSAALDYLLVDKHSAGLLSQLCRYYRALSRHRPEIAVANEFVVKTPGYSYGDDQMPTTRAMFLADVMTVLANGVTPGFESHGWYNRAFWSKQKATMASPSFDRIYREASREIKRREPWLAGTEPVRFGALLYSENSRDFYGQNDPERYVQCCLGWYKALLDRQTLFEVVTDRNLNARDLSQYAFLVLPNAACLSDAQGAAIREYVRGGGGLVASYLTSLCDEDGNPRPDFALADVFGASYVSGLEADYNLQAHNPARRDQFFMHFAAAHPLLKDAVHPGETFSLPAPSALVRVSGTGQGVGVFHLRRKEGRQWEGRADGISGQGRDEATDHPVLVMNRFGKGNVAYVPARMASSYGIHGHPALHRMMLNAVRMVAAWRSPVEVHAPKCVEVTAFRQPAKNRLVVHLVNYQSLPYRAHLNNNMPYGGTPPVEEILPVSDLRVVVELPPAGKPCAVYEAPTRAKLKWAAAGSHRIRITLPRLEIHSMVVLEWRRPFRGRATWSNAFHRRRPQESAAAGRARAAAHEPAVRLQLRKLKSRGDHT